MEREIVTRQQAIERLLTKYFTGQACRHGHVAERYTINGTCQACINERMKVARRELSVRLKSVTARA